MNEDIVSAAFLLDEAEALLDVEELHDAPAGADDLGRHAAEAAATAGATQAATAAARAATSKAIAAAKAIAAKVARGQKTVIPAAKRIEAVFAETVALVAAAPASPIVTHISEHTLPYCPTSNVPMAWTVSRTG
ncbi:MAG: hypothetical protein OHK0018_01730 [Erythrobacter tepidarius]